MIIHYFGLNLDAVQSYTIDHLNAQVWRTMSQGGETDMTRVI